MTTPIRFPLDDLMDEDRCYAWLVNFLHPEGLQCPNGHPRPPDQCPHTRNRAPIVEYRCRPCGRVYNVFTDTVLNGIRYSCSQIVMVLHGFFKGTPTLQMADELGLDRSNLLHWRHHLQALLSERFPPLGSSRPGNRVRRDVPERRREGDSASRSRGSAPASRQQATRSRNVRERSSTDRRNRRT